MENRVNSLYIQQQIIGRLFSWTLSMEVSGMFNGHKMQKSEESFLYIHLDYRVYRNSVSCGVVH